MAQEFGSLSARLGGALGRGLAQGLEGLASAKAQQLQEMHQKQQQETMLKRLAEGLKAYPGMENKSEVERMQLAGLGEKLLGPLLKEQAQAPYNQQVASLYGAPHGAPEGTDVAANMARLKPKDVKDYAAFQQREQERALKEERFTYEKNKPFLEEHKKRYESDQEALDLVNRFLELSESGKIDPQYWGYLANPNTAIGKIAFEKMNPETQEAYSIATKLANIGAAAGKNSVAHLASEQMSKPSIFHAKESRENLLNRLKKKVQKTEFEEQAIEQIRQEHGDKDPRDLEKLVTRRAKEIRHEAQKAAKEADDTEKLPGFESAENEETWNDPETGQIFMKVDGKPVEVEAIPGSPGEYKLKAGV